MPNTSFLEALLPRATSGAYDHLPYSSQALGAGLDLLSAPGRALQSLGDMPATHESFNQAMARTRPRAGSPVWSEIPQSIMRDPALIPSLLPPVAAGLKANALRTLATGALGYGLTNAAERTASGQANTPGQVAQDVTQALATGVALHAAARPLRAAAARTQQMLNKILAPEAAPVTRAAAPAAEAFVAPSRRTNTRATEVIEDVADVPAGAPAPVRRVELAPPPAPLVPPPQPVVIQSVRPTAAHRIMAQALAAPEMPLAPLLPPPQPRAPAVITAPRGPKPYYADMSNADLEDLFRIISGREDMGTDLTQYFPIRDVMDEERAWQPFLSSAAHGTPHKPFTMDIVRDNPEMAEVLMRNARQPVEPFLLDNPYADYSPMIGTKNIDPRTKAGDNFAQFYGGTPFYNMAGLPTPWFHGTANPIQDFSTDFSGASTGSAFGGFPGYFSAGPKDAHNFAVMAKLGREKYEAARAAGMPIEDYEHAMYSLPDHIQAANANISPVYIRAENPLRVRNPMDMLNKLGLTKIIDGFDLQVKESARRALRNQIRSQGHDAIWVARDGAPDWLLPVQSHQIKSVYNRGTWDWTNPDIMKALPLGLGLGAGLATQAQKGNQ